MYKIGLKSFQPQLEHHIFFRSLYMLLPSRGLRSCAVSLLQEYEVSDFYCGRYN